MMPSDKTSTPLTKTRALRWLLVGSLTLNLLVAGVVGGSLLRSYGEGSSGGPRSQAFGPWSAGVGPQDRDALRQAFKASGTDVRAQMAEERRDRGALIAALRADPYVPAEAEAIADRMQARAQARVARIEGVMRTHIRELSLEDRRAFADRLEAGHMRKRATPPPRP